MRSFLFICNDHIGARMAGPGIRSQELAQALARKGHKAALLARRVDPGASGEGLSFVGRASFRNLVARIRRAEIVVLPGRPLAILLCILFRKTIVFDQYDPVIFEFLERRASSLGAKIGKGLLLFLWRMRQRLIIRFGDAFLVANEKQKDFLIGQMALRGRGERMERIAVLPFGLPDAGPVKKKRVLRGTVIADTDFLLVWGGGIWEWFDPFTLLAALAEIAKTRSNIKAYFPGIRPPNPDSRKMAVTEAFLAEARTQDLLDRIVFVNKDWTPYADRAEYLLEADAGISLHKDGLETRFAFRTRILDYLWAGLPVIASQGDGWAEVIEREGIGTTVPCGDAGAVARAVTALADDRSARAQCRENAQRIAASYSWDCLADRMPFR